jgi:UDP-sugar transporter A1/2/3
MIDLKWIALVALILQNSGVAIVMKSSFVYADPQNKFISSTAVLAAEVLKLLLSLMICFVADAKCSVSGFIELLRNECGGDFLKLSVPSILYTLQNSLQYVSMSFLSAPVFQVLYQMKIITTAVFSVLLLARRISVGQWMSVVALASGVALVQLSQQKNANDRASSIIGLVSVLCGCVTSGFAGVYLEMVLKSSKSSIWLRNIQLSVIGIVISACSCYLLDGPELHKRGFLAGYDKFVWGVIVLQAAGGLVSST